MFFTDIPSPAGPLLLASDGTAVTGLWLEDQKYFAAGLDPAAQKAPALPVFRETRRWLEDYFAGRRPPALPPLAPAGSAFRKAVWKKLLEIPYGQTRTYGALAAELGSSSPRRQLTRPEAPARVKRRMRQFLSGGVQPSTVNLAFSSLFSHRAKPGP